VISMCDAVRRRRLSAVLASLSSPCIGGLEDEVATLEAAVLVDTPWLDSGQIVVRPASQADLVELDLVTHYSFARLQDPAEVLSRDPPVKHPPTWGAFTKDGQPVASLVSLEWSLAGTATCEVAAVAGVGTLPEFRRLGLLRTMMTMLFQTMLEKHQPIAALYASQAAIYQRYGYARAMPEPRQYSIDTVDIQFIDGDGGSYRVTRRSANKDLEPTLVALYSAFFEQRVGGFSWDQRRQTELLLASASTVAGSGSPPTYCAVATDAEGMPRGYVIYQVGGSWNDPTNGNSITPGHPTRGQKLTVHELIWTDLDAYKSIWSFLSRHDLVGEVVVMSVPPDDPAPLVFLEPRMLRTSVQEGSWWRIVDVKGALESRSYSAALGSELILSVTDDDRLAPWNTGKWKLSLNPESGDATVNKLEHGGPAPEVTLRVEELVQLWSGATSARQLSASGLLEASGTEALRKADHMFQVERAPFCPDHW
jgi:predicted acetyltransferase